MIGITNSTSSGEIKDGLAIISLTTNQSTHSDLLGVSFVVTYEGFSERFTWNGFPIVVLIPNGVSYSVSPEDIDGYKTPSVYNDVSTEGYKVTLALEYKCTVVTIKMDDNQPNYDDIANATATVTASGMTTKNVSNNGSVKVPTGENCSITWNAITGYKTPDKQTFTTSGTSLTKTGTYQTEILTVTVTSDIDLPASYTITVSGIGSQTTASKVYKIPFGTSYTISASDASGYVTPESQTFTASQSNRTISIMYLEYVIPPGVYIQHVNGTLFSESQWTNGGYANASANGVVVIGNDVSFVISKTYPSNYNVKWGGYSKSVTGVLATSSESNAILDYKGFDNTAKIVKQCANWTQQSITGAPAADESVAYTFPNGNNGYLPALGEWKLAFDNKEAVNSAMSLIGGANIVEGYHWSSTQGDDGTGSWALNWKSGSLYKMSRLNRSNARAFTTL